MIIQSVQAENILKYERLQLQDLPAQGVIAISGQNESGKSSIGETICFALFGRTFSLDHDDLNKLIRWGENRASVSITFLEDGNGYTLSRGLDMEGNHSAKLCRAEDPDHPIATGAEPVTDALFKLTGFGYDEFIESFYLAQREITSPHPHSMTLKTIAGISTLEMAGDMIDRDLQSADDNIRELQAEQQQDGAELDSMAIDPKHLHRLQTEKKEAEKAAQRLEDVLDDYESSFIEYATAYPLLVKSLTTRKGLAIGLTLSFVLMLFLFFCWTTLMFNPDPQIGWLINLGKHLPGSMAWVALPVILLAFFVREYNLKIKRLRKTGAQLAEKIKAVCSLPEIVQNVIKPWQDLIGRSGENEIAASKIAQEMHPALNHLQELLDRQKETLQGLIEPIRLEEERRERAAALEKRITELGRQLDDLTRANTSREIAIELLTGASRYLSRRFNHVIREHVGSTLPLFTEGRYEHLEIDNEMTIQVFSSEKRGYLDLDEISSGTQRQIMLAVRLALSQELASRRVRSKQFLILDEPFAFFDQERTINSLAVLPELSEDLPQIFVTSQVFPQGSSFQREIACTRETQVLQ